MKLFFRCSPLRSQWPAFCLLLIFAVPLAAQTCQETQDMDPATRSAIEGTAQRFQQMSAAGDVNGLRSASTPSLAENFDGVARAITDNQQAVTGKPVLTTYLLELTGNAPAARAEFFCGVFGANGNTANSAGFVLPNLQPGRYALVIMHIAGPKGPYLLSEILQQVSGSWKLAGYYVKSAQIGGHDSDWYAQKAREYRQKGQVHNAWFYFLEARELAAPVPFMSTLKLDKLYEEAQRVKPGDMPTDGPVTASLDATHTTKLLAAFPIAVDNQLDLVVKYQAADISNTAQVFLDNTALMKSLVVKYPEFREAFNAIVARAVAPNGQDYGTLLAMKDIK